MRVATESKEEMQRRVMSTESEFDKEKALLEQKIKFLEDSLKEHQDKEKRMVEDFSKQKKEYLDSNKEGSSRFEGQLKSMTEKNDELNEQVLEKEAEIQKVSLLLEQETLSRSELEKQLAERGELSSEAASKLQSENEQLKKTLDELEASTSENLNSELDALKEELNTVSQELQASMEENRQQKIQFQKDQAIHIQKVEFLEDKLSEAKTQLVEGQKQHETMMAAFNNVEQRHGDSKLKSDELLELQMQEHLSEIKSIQEEFEAQKARLVEQVESLSNSKNQTEISMNVQVTELSKQRDELEASLEQMMKERDEAQNLNMTQDRQKIQMMEEVEERHREKYTALEKELEDQLAAAQDELKEVTDSSEEQLQQMKNLFEIERETLTKRITEEKAKGQRSLNQLLDEQESKIKEEQAMNEEQIEMLQLQLEEQEAHSQGIIGQLNYDLSLKTQKIENLEEHLAEMKQSLDNMHSQNSLSLEQHLEKFNEERRQLTEKTESLQSTISSRDRDITNLENKLESLNGELAKRLDELEEVREELVSVKEDYRLAEEKQREEKQVLSEKIMEKTLDADREAALTEQRCQFLDKRIAELQDQNSKDTTKYEERLATLKADMLADQKERQDRAAEEITKVTERFEMKRKQVKDLEAEIGRLNTQNDREKAVADEKLSNAKHQYLELDQKTTNEINELKFELDQLSERNIKDIQSLEDENDMLKDTILKLESDCSLVTSDYERDKALWKEKLEFLTNQKKQAKDDLKEAQKKFELTIEQLQRKDQNDKGKVESAQIVLFNQIEKKYKDQIRTIQENHEEKERDYQKKLRDMEKEKKQLEDRIDAESRGSANAAILERRLEEQKMNENRLKSELEGLKSERDNKMIEFQNLLEKERESHKEKLAASEKRVKEAQFSNQRIIFEVEKDKAQQQIKINQQEMRIDELQATNEQLMSTNSKLKKNQEKQTNARRTAQQKYNMFTGNGVSSSITSLRGENRLGGKGSEGSYVPTAKKFSSPRFNQGYLQESNKSSEKKPRSKYSVKSSIDKTKR